MPNHRAQKTAGYSGTPLAKKLGIGRGRSGRRKPLVKAGPIEVSNEGEPALSRAFKMQSGLTPREWKQAQA